MGNVFVIADPGSCHEGSLYKAKKLIETAHFAGADAVKFQYWSDGMELAVSRNMPNMTELYEKYKMPGDWLPLLFNECEKVGIEFMCTVYLSEDIETVDPFVKRHKVSHMESANMEFVCELATTGKPMIISADRDNDYTRIKGCDQTPLLCVGEYPAEIRDYLNYEDRFQVAGLSDHTTSIFTGGIFVYRCGVLAVEKHLKLHETGNCPDEKVALSPADFKLYVRYIREMEAING